MVVLLDLDQDEIEGPFHTGSDFRSHYPLTEMHAPDPEYTADEEEARPNPNINSFSEALGCYPYAATTLR